MNKYSKRTKQWKIFSNRVVRHIEDYTVPQYGDYPDDQVSSFTEEEIISQFKRYVNRLGSNARGPVEAERDLFKIAHYAALLHFKREQDKNSDTYEVADVDTGMSTEDLINLHTILNNITIAVDGFIKGETFVENIVATNARLERVLPYLLKLYEFTNRRKFTGA